MFRVGQKVIFVGPDRSGNALDQVVPIYGAMYTIRSLAVITGINACLVNEIRNEPLHWSNGFMELYFETKFFRPAVERNTDISIFTKMLMPKKRRVQERA